MHNACPLNHIHKRIRIIGPTRLLPVIFQIQVALDELNNGWIMENAQKFEILKVRQGIVLYDVRQDIKEERNAK